MSNLYAWFNKWRNQIPPAAALEFQMALGLANDHAPPVSADAAKGSEARQQSLVRLEAARRGDVMLTRNNVGALLDKRGVPVRYGLWNESAQQNEHFKSSDLIGIRKRLIVQADVGTHIGQFVAREMKEEGWNFTGDAHEVAQLKCIETINAFGGDARFCTGPGSFDKW